MRIIPERIKYVLKAPRTISRTVLGKKQTMEVREAFPVPASSEKMLETAIKWAKGYGYVAKSWMKGSSHYKTAMDKKDMPDIVEVENTPFATLTIWRIDTRGEGGRAFKVVTPEGYYVDLREPEFLEACLSGGMKKGGKVGGRFQWILNETQMRLGIVKGELHKSAVPEAKAEAEKAKAKKPKIPISKLVPGGVYRSTGGNWNHQFVVYAGRVRVKGKLMCAWIEPHIIGGRKPSKKEVTEFLERWNTTTIRGTIVMGRPCLVLKGTCSYTEHLFTVPLPAIPEKVEYSNGYGEILSHPVEWV